MGADGVGAGRTAIQADITAAVDADSLALLEEYAAARVAGPGVPAEEVAKNLA
jgi:hypothetical protein